MSPILTIDELHLLGDVRIENLLSGQLPIEKMVARRPHLALIRHESGRWNVQSLLPLPKFSDAAPGLTIEDATVEFRDTTRPATPPFALRSVGATFTPLAPAAQTTGERTYQVAGSAAGPSASAIRADGQVSAGDGAVDLAIHIDGLDVSPELLAALPLPWPDPLKGTELTGRANLAMTLTRSAGTQAAVGWSAELKLERGRLKHGRLPEPLTDLSVDLKADAGQLLVRRLSARWGTASMILACDRRGWSPSSPLAARIVLQDLTLNPEHAQLLPSSLAACWQRFQPVGRIDADIALEFDGQQWRPRVVAGCRGVTLTDHEQFRYPLQQATGRIEYLPATPDAADKLSIDLTGTGGDRPVRVQAELTRLMADASSPVVGAAAKVAADPSAISEPRRRAIGWVEISGTDIPVHEQLLAALEQRSASVGRFVRSLRPQGAFDFRWRSARSGPYDPQAETTQQIMLKDCSLQFERFEYPLRRVNGLITEHNREWVIHNVTARGSNDSTEIVCRGGAAPAADGYRMDLTFQGTNVPLDETLKQALAPPAQQAWDSVRPQGRVDLTARMIHEPGPTRPVFEIVVSPREKSVSIEPRQFPYRLERLEGSARFTAGMAEFHRLTAHHDSVKWSIKSGAWQALPEGGWQLAFGGLAADRLTPERDLVGALPLGLREILERLQPSGMFALNGGGLTFLQRPGAEAIAAAWDVQLDCDRATFGGGLPLTNLTGVIRLAGSADGPASYTAGELQLDSLTWKGMQLTSIRGPLWADRSECLFGQPAAAKLGRTPQPITADAYSGSVTADIRIEHKLAPEFRVDAAMGGVDLGRLSRERFGGPAELKGIVSGKLSLEGTGHSTKTLRGGGDLHVIDANIYELPIIVSMLKVLKNRSPNSTAFNSCDMQFQIVGEDIRFPQLNLVGDAVSLYGKGQTSFDRRLDLVFYSLMGPADVPFQPLAKLFGQASKQFLELHVTGTWDDPLIEPKALPAINSVLQQIHSEVQAGAATVTSPATLRGANTPQRR
jgi:hypothetical protein